MSTTQAMRPARKLHRPNVTTLALVGALHVVVIYGLYLGLTKQFSIPTIKDFQTQIIKQKTKVEPPPPPTGVTFVKPQGQTIVEPKIPVDNSFEGPGTNTAPPAGNTIEGPTAPVIVTARVIADTHTIPNYPPLSVRLGQTGDVKLKLTIDERGAVVAATVEKSSGYDALDNAAVAWVIAHWRYEPATKDGKPFATTTDAQVTFRLTGR
jgi:protein TonB